MATEANGKLIIRSIPSVEVAQKVVTYVCANTRNTSSEAVAGRLENLPLILSNSISAQVGNRVVQSLVEIGADAVFIPDQSTAMTLVPENIDLLPPIQTRPTPATTASPTAPTVKQVTTEVEHPAPVANKQTPHVYPGVVPRKPVDDLCEIAVAQKLLICAIPAGLLPIFSPFLFFPAVAFELYAVYRICKVLQIRMLSRVIYMICTILPFLGIINLLIINSKATTKLRAGGVTVGLFGAHQAGLDGLGCKKDRAVLVAMVYLGGLVIVALGGITTGLLPLEFPDHLAETKPAPALVPIPEDPVPFAQAAAPDVRGEITTIYEKYHNTKVTGNVDEMLKYVSERNRKQIQSVPSALLKTVTGKLVKSTAPSSISVTDCTVSPDGNRAVLALTGKVNMFGTETESEGLVSFLKEGAEWKLDFDTWKTKESPK